MRKVIIAFLQRIKSTFEGLIRIRLTNLFGFILIVIGLFWLNQRSNDFEFKYDNSPASPFDFEAFPLETQEVYDLKNRKKEKYLNTPNIAFHFADKDQIKSFYKEYFKEPILESQIQERISENGQSGKGNLEGMLEAEANQKNINKHISTLKYPETTLNGMFARYLKETLINDQVAVGLEDLELELEQVEEFNLIFERLESEFGYDLDENRIEQHRQELKTKASKQTLEMLESAKGWAIVEGNFLLTLEGNFYKLTYDHPINQVIANDTINIAAIFPIDGVEQSFTANYKNSIGSYIPVTIYGKIWKPVNVAHQQFELQLTPMAIY